MIIEGKKYLEEPIKWTRRQDAEYPYEAQYGGHELLVRLNDFPAEELYALIEDGREVTNFDDWPTPWSRAGDLEDTSLFPVSSHFDPERILIVDDDELIRKGIMHVLLDKRSYTFGEAGTAAEALRLVSEQEWDVVIVDSLLPDNSGVELLKQIRKLRSEIRVLVLSINPEEQSVREAFEAGVAGYVLKADAATELVTAVDMISLGLRYVSLVFFDLVKDFDAHEASIQTMFSEGTDHSTESAHAHIASSEQNVPEILSRTAVEQRMEELRQTIPLRDIFQGLSDYERQIFLASVKGLSVAEIAEIVGENTTVLRYNLAMTHSKIRARTRSYRKQTSTKSLVKKDA